MLQKLRNKAINPRLSGYGQYGCRIIRIEIGKMENSFDGSVHFFQAVLRAAGEAERAQENIKIGFDTLDLRF
jgi:hypothetical protein